jgi:hypothetical protein
MKKTLILILFSLVNFIYFTNIIFASDVSVYRECPVSEKVGSVVQINITIENKGTIEKYITVNENLGNFEAISPKPIVPVPTPGTIGLRLPYYEWNFTLPANSKNTVSYMVKLVNPGDIVLSPTTAYADGETIFTNVCTIKVICNQNGICEPNLGENYFTCPEDCPSGSADGVCDLVKDGRCDPDCAPGTDPDCLTITTIGATTTTTPVGKPSSTIYIYIIIIAIVITVAVFFLLRIKTVRADNI